jgi:hypothetical protein
MAFELYSDFYPAFSFTNVTNEQHQNIWLLLSPGAMWGEHHPLIKRSTWRNVIHTGLRR